MKGKHTTSQFRYRAYSAYDSSILGNLLSFRAKDITHTTDIYRERFSVVEFDLTSGHKVYQCHIMQRFYMDFHIGEKVLFTYI